jgi:SAM-dependent methyltransferase
MKIQAPDFWKEAYKVRYESRITAEQTAVEVAFIMKNLERTHAKTILDFACGYGRHALPLAVAGYRVNGYDNDDASIRRAKAAARKMPADARPHFERCNLASDPPDQQFDAGLCLYSSIGFLTEEQNTAMLANFLGAIKIGGLAILDLQSAAWTREQEPLDEERSLTHQGRAYRIRHERACEKHPLCEINRLTFDPPLDGLAEHGYTLRLYERAEVEAILKRHGFAVVSVHGSFAGDQPNAVRQREITVARRLSATPPESKCLVPPIAS